MTVICSLFVCTCASRLHTKKSDDLINQTYLFDLLVVVLAACSSRWSLPVILTPETPPTSDLGDLFIARNQDCANALLAGTVFDACSTAATRIAHKNTVRKRLARRPQKCHTHNRSLFPIEDTRAVNKRSLQPWSLVRNQKNKPNICACTKAQLALRLPAYRLFVR